MFRKILALSWLNYAYIALLLAVVAFMGTLYYSDILRIPICTLCWYQRITMYPLLVIFFVGILLRDKKCFYYALPLIVIGTGIAFYQVLLQVHAIPNFLISCKSSAVLGSVSCADINFRLFGIFTIPQQALLGFFALLGVSVVGVSNEG